MALEYPREKKLVFYNFVKNALLKAYFGGLVTIQYLKKGGISVGSRISSMVWAKGGL